MLVTGNSGWLIMALALLFQWQKASVFVSNWDCYPTLFFNFHLREELNHLEIHSCMVQLGDSKLRHQTNFYAM